MQFHSQKRALYNVSPITLIYRFAVADFESTCPADTKLKKGECQPAL